jgi:cytochrome P450
MSTNPKHRALRSEWTPLKSDVYACRTFLEEYKNKKLPDWIQNFHGPFNDLSIEDVVREFLAGPRIIIWQIWAERYLKNGLGTMVIPGAYFENGKPILNFSLFFSSPDEAMRMGRAHVSKDAQLGLTQSKHVVNIPDVNEWKRQRRHITDAFLPQTVISTFIPKLINMSQAMCNNWMREIRSSPGDYSEIDVRSWMHHTALAMFVNCMMGDDRAFSKEYENPEANDLNIFSSYEDDLDFADTTPINSIAPRSLFNLEGIQNSRTPKEMEQRFNKIISYALKLFTRGKERKDRNEDIGPLLERLMELDDNEAKVQNMLATLVAGHDTTAYTMQYCLLELARNPELQHRARNEVIKIYKEIEREGRQLQFSDIPRFEFVTKCICESLRLWNVASTVFPRVTSFDDKILGKDGNEVNVKKGTKFSFWFYGQHHSKELWGDDAMEYNPDREWLPEELQQSPDSNRPLLGTSVTPCTKRFHPFSLPTRDCVGKNFALTEMRILIPHILRNFYLEIPHNSDLQHVKPSMHNKVFNYWANHIGGPVQPHVLKLKVIPIRNSYTKQTNSSSKL